MTIPTTGPDARTRQFTTIMADAAVRAMRHAQAAPARRVTPEPDALQALADLGGPLPETPTDAATVLATLDEIGGLATVASTAGRFFGFVTGGVFPVCLGATWLAAAWNQNAGLRIMSPVGGALEDIVLACGRRSAAWADAASPSWWSAAAITRNGSRRASEPLGSPSSTTSSSIRCS